MKKTISILLVLCLALACLSACGASKPAAAPAAPAAAPAAPAADAAPQAPAADPAEEKTYNFTFSMHTSLDSRMGQYYCEMFEKIKEETDGHVIITPYGSATLAAAGAVSDMVRDGGCDLGWMFSAFYAGVFPLSEVISVPLAGQQDCRQGAQVLWDLWENFPEMRAEYDNYKVLQMYGGPVNYIYSTKPIACMDDLKGVTLRSTSGGIATVLMGWGANVVSMPPNDIYDSISKGNIGGYTFEPTGIVDYSLGEVTPYFTDMTLYHGIFTLIMNKDSYNSLPDKYKAVIDKYSGREASLDFADMFDGYVNECHQAYIAAGTQPVAVSDEAYAEFKAVADEYASSWVENNAREGFDAQAYYDFAFDAYAKYAR